MLNALLWNLLLTTGLALVLAAFCRLPSVQHRPALVHWFWLLLLVKLVTPPLIPIPVLPATDGQERVADSTFPGTPLADEEWTWSQPTPSSAKPEFPAEPLVIDDLAPASYAPTVLSEQSAVAPNMTRISASFPIAAGLLTLSLIGTCLLFMIHTVRAAKFNRWLERAAMEDPSLTETCAELAARMGIRGKLRSGIVDTRITPLLWGWCRPMVVIPRQLVDELQPERLHCILAHELAHLVRRDHWANLFVCVVKALMWWNPVVWWADRELRVAQELCCDAIAIDQCQTRRSTYAATLLETLDFIQPPVASSRLALGMGSRGDILRRFEMIGEKELSYRMSRWAILGVVALGTALACMPVRAQEETLPAKPTPSDSSDKPQAIPLKTRPIDSDTRKLGEAVRKRLSDYSDAETLTLKDGETGRMKVKKNITPVANILITPHFEADGTIFDVEGLDAEGNPVAGVQATSTAVRDKVVYTRSLGLPTRVDGRMVICKLQLAPSKQDDGRVAVETKVLFVLFPTEEEWEAMRSTRAEQRLSRSSMEAVRRMVLEFEHNRGRFPKELAELKTSLPKDVYSQKGENYRYEALGRRFVLSGCGKDGAYGNDDDEIRIVSRSGDRFGLRRDLYPLQEDPSILEQSEWTRGERPHGSCSIGGRVVSAETGEPVNHATVCLFFGPTHSRISAKVAGDGTFMLKDIGTGPYSLSTTNTAGYRSAIYDPEKGDSHGSPRFSLEEGEQRSGVVLELEPACQISGRVLDENGNIPECVDELTVLAWFERDDGMGFFLKPARLNSADGTYSIDTLDNKPVYLMAINWQSVRKDDVYPPIYYPSTFNRDDAKLISFDDERNVESIDITLTKEGGLVLEGSVVDEAGTPVPEALVVVHRRDMLFDFVTAYTDEDGKYRVHGLGSGGFLVHVDATHRGLLRTRSPVDLDGANIKTRRDFTLAQGVTISGKFVDEKGDDWQIGPSQGYATIPEGNGVSGAHTFSQTRFRSKFGVQDVRKGPPGFVFSPGEGNYRRREMIFSTNTTFVIPGMMAGHTQIEFAPLKDGQEVIEIRHQGRNILATGMDTTPGETIEDLVIVIGEKEAE